MDISGICCGLIFVLHLLIVFGSKSSLVGLVVCFCGVGWPSFGRFLVWIFLSWRLAVGFENALRVFFGSFGQVCFFFVWLGIGEVLDLG